MNKKEMIQVAESINLIPNDDVIVSLENLFDALNKQIEAMRKIDTNGVKPMVFVDETPISFLREDVPTQALTREQVLTNATHQDGEFVVIPKGVKND